MGVSFLSNSRGEVVLLSASGLLLVRWEGVGREEADCWLCGW